MAKPKILLIDDDIALVDMYTLKFQMDGTCDLVTATTPGKGLELAEQSALDLILLDLVLPKTERSFGKLNQEVGFHVLEVLKNSPLTKDIPVIIFTNLDERTKDNVQRAKAMGAIDYWVKAHWQPSQVVQKVKNVIASIRV